MLGDSTGLGGGGEDAGAVSSGASPAAAVGGVDGGGCGGGGGGGSNSGDEYEKSGERSFGGNRWPRQETLALLKIRSDMDATFRDATVKGPLWEQVSRKLAELGYHRSAKKCKEKFENVYKYHKRTKEGRSGKSEGKTYRFFDQLEALENNPSAAIQSPRPAAAGGAVLSATPVSMVKTTASLPPHPIPMPQQQAVSATNIPILPITTTTSVPSTMPPQPPNLLTTPSSFPPQTNPTYFHPTGATTTTTTTAAAVPPPPPYHFPAELLSNSISSNSSTSSDETIEGRRKRKRKWKDLFEKLMKEVIEKQEELQRRFLEAIEKREQERNAREEAWRVQEMQRINRERDILAQERSIAAAKDQAVMSFLQKIAEQQNIETATINNVTIPQQPPPQTPMVQSQPLAQVVNVTNSTTTTTTTTSTQPVVAVVPLVGQPQQVMGATNMEMVKADNNGGENIMGAGAASSSRWPKAEVQALINLRTSLDAKYSENVPKGPLWEEISGLMKKMGYNRSAKRCKEKWENINKYFKKVKESNKKRPQDSKTCPYFHQLDALYKEKSKNEGGGGAALAAPLMVRPEQQWPPQQDVVASAAGQPPEVAMEEARGQQEQQHDGDDDDDDEEEEEEDKDVSDEDDDDDEGGGNNYEIVPSKPVASSSTMGASAAE